MKNEDPSSIRRILEAPERKVFYIEIPDDEVADAIRNIHIEIAKWQLMRKFGK